MATPPPGARFLTLVDVAEILNTSSAQVYALVRGGDLPAIKFGGRGQGRVESRELETYILRLYEQTRDFVSSHRFGRPEDEAERNAAPHGNVEPDGEPVGREDG
jgi:excisionase family DNA binding protein